MLILILFSSLFMKLLLLFIISDVLREKEVGGNHLCPVKVIETADPNVDWAATEGMPTGMVSQVYHNTYISHYIECPSYSHG